MSSFENEFDVLEFLTAHSPYFQDQESRNEALTAVRKANPLTEQRTKELEEKAAAERAADTGQRETAPEPVAPDPNSPAFRQAVAEAVAAFLATGEKKE